LQVANIFAGFLTALPYVGSQICKHRRTIQLKNVVVLKIHADPCRLFVLFQILSPIKYARNVNIYDDAKRADKPNLWILLLTEWVIRLAENLADVGKSNIYRFYLQNDFRFLIVNCALKNYKCVNSQLIVAESLNSQYNQCVKVRFERTERGMMSWRLVTRDYGSY